MVKNYGKRSRKQKKNPNKKNQNQKHTNQQCPICKNYFRNLRSHLSQKESCNQRYRNHLSSSYVNDPSFITNIKTPKKNQFSRSQHDLQNYTNNLHEDQFNLNQSMDMDQSLLQVYNISHARIDDDDIEDFQPYTDDNENVMEFTQLDASDQRSTNSQSQQINNQHEQRQNQNNRVTFSPSLSGNKSSKNSVIRYDPNWYNSLKEYTESLQTSNQPNSSTSDDETSLPSSSTSTLLTPPTITQDYITPDRVLYIDFTKTQHLIQKFHYNLNLDFNTIHSIMMLKLSFDDKISSNTFRKIMKIQENHTNHFLNDNVPDGALKSYPKVPKKKTSVNRLISNLIFQEYSNTCSSKKSPPSVSNSNSNDKRKFSLMPTSYQVELPSRLHTKITKIDVCSSILSLLNDTTITNPSNLLIENPYFRNPLRFNELDDDQKMYDDIHTGSWFLNAYKNVCDSSRGDILCPIILFIDGTPIDAYSNLKLDAVMFTLGIYNRKARNKNNSWRLIGYIPETTDEEFYDDGSDKQSSKAKREKQQRTDYHHMLHFLLQDIIDMQNSDGILWNYVDSNNKVITIRLRPTLMFIIGDALGNDKLCNRKQGYTKKTDYLCRDCLCHTKDLERLDIKCQFTKRSYLNTLSEKDLFAKSYHLVTNNVFDIIHFGYDEFGINGCTPSEFLHQFLLGVVKKMMESFFNSITGPGLSLLRNVSKYISCTWYRQSDKSFPNIGLFHKDLKKKKLTGDEHIDQVFMLFLTLSQSNVMTKLVQIESVHKPRKKTLTTTVTDEVTGEKKEIKEEILYPKIGASTTSLQNWITLLEKTLCFYFWIKQEKVSYNDIKESDDYSFDSNSDIAIRDYLKLYKKIVFVPTGNGNCSMKDHQTLHIPHQIRRFGIPLNYDGGIGERHLKQITKEPARMTQRRQSTLEYQACRRYSERLSVNLIYQILLNNKKIDPIDNEFDDESDVEYNSDSNDDQDNGLFHFPNNNRIHMSTRMSYNNDIERHTREETSSTWKAFGYYKYYMKENGILDYATSGSDNRKFNKKNCHQPSIIQEIYKRLKEDDIDILCDYITCFTQLGCRIDHNNKYIFHADPCYSERPWFDWCITKWDTNQEGNTDVNTSCFPARLLMFIDLSAMKFGCNVLEQYGNYIAIVKACDNVNQTNRRVRDMIQKKSDLISTYTVEEKIRLISCSSIVGPAYVSPDLESDPNPNKSFKFNQKFNDPSLTHKVSRVMVIEPTSKWPKRFVTGQETPQPIVDHSARGDHNQKLRNENFTSI